MDLTTKTADGLLRELPLPDVSGLDASSPLVDFALRFLAGFAIALLNQAGELFLPTLDAIEVVIGKRTPIAVEPCP